jgi:plasmid stabilization system protein ParE
VSIKVDILESAEYDLKELKVYLVKNFSVATWQSSYGQIKEVIRNLQRFPLAGSIPDEFESLDLTQYRQVIAGMNRIIYEVRGDNVYVHIIVDARRDLKSLLIRRLLRVV